jgi:aryl-alcohol dehydrogenase-like predicted oxidoreductase
MPTITRCWTRIGQQRAGFERELKLLCEEQGIGVILYSPLAAGFLTDKCRRGQGWPASARAESIRKRYDNERSWTSLEALDKIGQARFVQCIQHPTDWAPTYLLSGPRIDCIRARLKRCELLESEFL